MVDCRSLVEFCRGFEQHRQTANLQASLENRNCHAHARSKRFKSLNPLSHPFCEQSPQAAMDVFMLILVLGSIGILTVPCFKLIYDEASEMFPVAVNLMGEVVCPTYVAYATAFVLMVVTGVALWEIINQQFRKCGNPKCRGLQKAVEFDIQLESEECVRFMQPLPKDAFGARPLELGQDHKELEAELKKMAPLNGRTVLIFRSPCGCPSGRMEVWGQKKVRRIKKWIWNSIQGVEFHWLENLFFKYFSRNNLNIWMKNSCNGPNFIKGVYRASEPFFINISWKVNNGNVVRFW